MSIEKAVQAIRQKASQHSTMAIILGSGLGDLVSLVQQPTIIAYDQIPGFTPVCVGGHAGQLVLGILQGQPVVILSGRVHRYGGRSIAQVTFPIRVLGALGVKRLIITNAAGALNPHFSIGDLVILRDHINLMGKGSALHAGNSMRPNHDSVHESMSRPTRHPNGALNRSRSVYDPAFCKAALLAARQEGYPAVQGTYLATLGPTYETRAEYQMMRRLGADVVGMSTVPEVLAAVQIGMRVLALSLVSNVANPNLVVATHHKEVLEVGSSSAPKLRRIIENVIPLLT